MVKNSNKAMKTMPKKMVKNVSENMTAKNVAKGAAAISIAAGAVAAGAAMMDKDMREKVADTGKKGLDMISQAAEDLQTEGQQGYQAVAHEVSSRSSKKKGKK